MKRPTLKIGDVVRLSKKGKLAYTKHKVLFDKMVVQELQGDSTDGRCKVVCTYFFGNQAAKGVFARKHLWSTGYNVYEKTLPSISVANVTNNNGKMLCIKCNQPTRLIMGIVRSYDVCKNTLCTWYNN